jgi:predicted dithiol-disulfide oxidoreductase (DUF899 family)/uncharacterized protein YndB with AHSA1/START domain
MTTKTAAGAFVVEREIHIEAPRERVFSLLASPEEMRRWFRPTMYEPRPGGRIEFAFPFDGEVSESKGEVTVFEPPSRLGFTWSWSSAPMANTEVLIELSDERGGTLLRLTHTGFVDEAAAQGHQSGWTYWMDRLTAVATGGDPGPDKFVPAEKRNALVADVLKEEIALRDHAERVAEMRRALPLPDPLEDDYTLTAQDDTLVRFSELFGDKDEMLVYHLMFHPDEDEACPMCSMWVDGYNAIAPHVQRRAAFVVVAKAPIGKLRAWAKRRGWDRIPVYSSYSTTFNKDFHAEDAEGNQRPVISAFKRDGEKIYNTYQKCAELVPDEEYRGIDLLSPVWNLLDLTPSGRGEWLPDNQTIVK